MQVLIVHTGSPAHQLNVQRIRDFWHNRGHNVVKIKCRIGEFDSYRFGLSLVWEVDDIVIIEEDKYPTFGQMLTLEKADGDVNAYAYQCYPVSTHLDRPVYVHRRVLAWNGHVVNSAAWIENQDQESDLYGFGCTKISMDVQRRVPTRIWMQYPGSPDHAISMATARLGVKARILWPEVEHRHL